MSSPFPFFWPLTLLDLQDSSLTDLAKKYNVTLESIALQTRHILDTLNAAGHDVTEIFVSGGQTQNPVLMQRIADVCGVSIVLPGQSGEAAVVRGAAMLGRVAAEVSVNVGKEDVGELLWRIMVSNSLFDCCSC
jgi:ribulose kinase